MRSVVFTVLALVAVFTVGCGGSNVVGPLPPDATAPSLDASADALADAPAFDVPPPDITPRDLPAATDGPVTCAADRDCARGQRCLQGHCAEDVCLATETPCGAERCEMRCVPARDLCAAVRCGPDETCFAGRCVAGCFPAPCAGVTCLAGRYCDDGTGLCTRITACPGPCNEGFACHVRCLPRTACDGVSCAAGELCAEGRCVPNACAGVTCPAAALCIDGRCMTTCGCDPPCTRSPRDRCVVGRCMCARVCQADTPCGTDDGCGGRCVGPCSNPFATCDPVLFSCDCASRCTPASACGDDDGCGGRCDSGCGVGERCDAVLRRCTCVSRCPTAEQMEGFPCGALVPNECPGAAACGRGTGCPPGGRCNSTTFRCECVGTCGGDGGGMPPEMCMPMETPCGDRCVNLMTDGNNCGLCGVQCPFGTTCAGGRCLCPTPLTLCGDRCVNASIDDANCGGCGTTCTGRTTCTAGRCQCIPACLVDPNAVPCGVDIPNACPDGPSCGVGRDCPTGEVCDTRARRCVCVPRCPAGVRCGVADGCGGQCVGLCDAGSTCTRDSTDVRRYFCSEASCVSGCRCDEVCAANRCVPITCPSGDRPCPCQCCPFGQMCVGGSACVPVPP